MSSKPILVFYVSFSRCFQRKPKTVGKTSSPSPSRNAAMLTGKQESTSSLGINGSLLLGWYLFGISQGDLKVICHSQGFADHLRTSHEAISQAPLSLYDQWTLPVWSSHFFNLLYSVAETGICKKRLAVLVNVCVCVTFGILFSVLSTGMGSVRK